MRQANVLEQQFQGYPFIVSFVLYRLLKLAYKKADLLIAPSQAVAFDMKKYLGAKQEQIKVIYNPTITPELFDKAREDPNHKSIWLASSKIHILLSPMQICLSRVVNKYIATIEKLCR
ncbi:MAG: glycosyltransferase family 4 protein [Cyanobacteria bacterium P01_G01_bin.19]